MRIFDINYSDSRTFFGVVTNVSEEMLRAKPYGHQQKNSCVLVLIIKIYKLRQPDISGRNSSGNSLISCILVYG